MSRSSSRLGPRGVPQYIANEPSTFFCGDRIGVDQQARSPLATAASRRTSHCGSERDVGDDDRSSDLHHGAARADARPHWLAVDAPGVFVGKARGSPHPYMNAVRVEQQDRTHLPFALILDEVDEQGQHLGERRAGRDHLEHLMLTGLECFRLPRRGHVARNGQELHDGATGVHDRRDHHVPPFHDAGGRSARSLKPADRTGLRPRDGVPERFPLLLLPQVDQGSVQQIARVFNPQSLEPCAVDVDQAAVEVEDLQAVATALERAMPHLAQRSGRKAVGAFARGPLRREPPIPTCRWRRRSSRTPATPRSDEPPPRPCRAPRRTPPRRR